LTHTHTHSRLIDLLLTYYIYIYSIYISTGDFGVNLHLPMWFWHRAIFGLVNCRISRISPWATASSFALGLVMTPLGSTMAVWSTCTGPSNWERRGRSHIDSVRRYRECLECREIVDGLLEGNILSNIYSIYAIYSIFQSDMQKSNRKSFCVSVSC